MYKIILRERGSFAVSMTKKQLRTIMGNNVRAERKVRSITIEELSEMLDISPGHMGMIERGERGLSSILLRKLSKLFDIPIDDFFKHDKSIFSSLDDITETGIRRKIIESLLLDFMDGELDLVISLTKEMRAMNPDRGGKGERRKRQ